MTTELWIPMKQWRREEGERRQRHHGTIARHLAEGKYPDLEIRRVNQRVVLVKVGDCVFPAVKQEHDEIMRAIGHPPEGDGQEHGEIMREIGQ